MEFSLDRCDLHCGESISVNLSKFPIMTLAIGSALAGDNVTTDSYKGYEPAMENFDVVGREIHYFIESSNLQNSGDGYQGQLAASRGDAVTEFNNFCLITVFVHLFISVKS